MAAESLGVEIHMYEVCRKQNGLSFKPLEISDDDLMDFREGRLSRYVRVDPGSFPPRKRSWRFQGDALPTSETSVCSQRANWKGYRSAVGTWMGASGRSSRD